MHLAKLSDEGESIPYCLFGFRDSRVDYLIDNITVDRGYGDAPWKKTPRRTVRPTSVTPTNFVGEVFTVARYTFLGSSSDLHGVERQELAATKYPMETRSQDILNRFHGLGA
jgi:hypothetical protein